MYTFVRNINKIILEKSYNVQSLFLKNFKAHNGRKKYFKLFNEDLV